MAVSHRVSFCLPFNLGSTDAASNLEPLTDTDKKAPRKAYSLWPKELDKGGLTKEKAFLAILALLWPDANGKTT